MYLVGSTTQRLNNGELFFKALQGPPLVSSGHTAPLCILNFALITYHEGWSAREVSF